MAAAKATKAAELPHVFTGSVEHAIAHIEESIQGKVDDRFLRWYAVKLFERDDKVMEELKLDKDYDTFEGEIQWCGKDVLLSLEVNAESKPSWTRARSAAKKLLADCETWDKAMRELAAKNLTELANNWLSQDEENPRNPETDPITEEELARRISMTSLSVTSGGSFTAWFDCDEMFTDHAVTVYGSLKKGLKATNIEG